MKRDQPIILPRGVQFVRLAGSILDRLRAVVEASAESAMRPRLIGTLWGLPMYEDPTMPPPPVLLFRTMTEEDALTILEHLA